MSLKDTQVERLQQYGVLWEHWKVNPEAIGKGGFSKVYKVQDNLGSVAALKVMTIEFDRELAQYGYRKEEYLESELQRRKTEIQLLSSLSQCPNIVSYQDYSIRNIYNASGKLDGYDLLIRMELLHPLSECLVHRKKMQEAEVVRLGRDICCALCDGRIAHRDIKPGNLFYAELKGYRVYKLGDLGVSKKDVGRSMTTHTGTPLYMAPEIYRHEKKYNPKAVDVYSLGVVLYQALAGKFPLEDSKDGMDAVDNALDRRMSGQKVPLLPATKSGVENVIGKALEYRAENRWQSAEEMLEQLNICMQRLEGKEPSSGDASLSKEELVRRANRCYADKKYEEALRLYRLAADKNEPYAMYSVGWQYAHGQGVHTDAKEAYRWYLRAAKYGSSLGMNELGNCYDEGKGVGRDREEAVKWYGKSADKGYDQAMYNLGYAYMHGRGVKQDQPTGVSWYQRAADKGNKKAMNSLGVAYDKGYGVQQNPAEALRWYRNAVEKKHAGAMFNLAMMYCQGRGVSKNYTEAKKLLDDAKRYGDSDTKAEAERMLQEIQKRA